jgi:hypothetical protein
VSIAANPAATAAAFAAFFAVPFTFERVIAPERFLDFATFFWVVLPRVEPLAPARFDDDFAVRFFAFFIFPLKDHCLSCGNHRLVFLLLERRCPSGRPREKAFWRNAPGVRFIDCATVLSGDLFLECLRSSCSCCFVHGCRVARLFFAMALP